jgi:hypothetical protein
MTTRWYARCVHLQVAVTLSEDFLCRCPRRTLRINAGVIPEADFNRKTLSVDARKTIFPKDNTECPNSNIVSKY